MLVEVRDGGARALFAISADDLRAGAPEVRKGRTLEDKLAFYAAEPTLRRILETGVKSESSDLGGLRVTKTGSSRPDLPLEFVFRDGVTPYVQHDHMFKIDPRGTTTPAAGVTYRVGVKNNTDATIEGVKVQLEKAEPPATPNVLPVVLRKRDDNIPPFRASFSFEVHSGQTELVDVIMKLEERDEIEVQQIVVGVAPPVLSVGSVLTLSVAGHNVRRSASIKLKIDTTRNGGLSMRVLGPTE